MGIKEIIEAVLKTADSNNERLLIYHDGSISRSTSFVNPLPRKQPSQNLKVLLGIGCQRTIDLFCWNTMERGSINTLRI